MKEIIIIILSAMLVENFVLSKFLGICPFLGVSKSLTPALGMSGAVVFVMTIASAVTWLVYEFLLEPFELEYLKIWHYIVIAYGSVC